MMALEIFRKRKRDRDKIHRDREDAIRRNKEAMERLLTQAAEGQKS